MYEMRDLGGEVIEGKFYEKELQAVAEPKVFRIENILKKRGRGNDREICVKWLGYRSALTAGCSATQSLIVCKHAAPSASMYMLLPSDVSSVEFPDNKAGRYFTRLERRPAIGGPGWEVGRADVVYDKSHFNVPEDQWVKWRQVHRNEDRNLDERIAIGASTGKNEIKYRFLRDFDARLTATPTDTIIKHGHLSFPFAIKEALRNVKIDAAAATLADTLEIT